MIWRYPHFRKPLNALGIQGKIPHEIRVILKARATCCITPVRPDADITENIVFFFFISSVWFHWFPEFWGCKCWSSEVKRHVGAGIKTDQHLLHLLMFSAWDSRARCNNHFNKEVKTTMSRKKMFFDTTIWWKLFCPKVSEKKENIRLGAQSRFWSF